MANNEVGKIAGLSKPTMRHYPEPTTVKFQDQQGKTHDVLFCNSCQRFVCICAQMEDPNFATHRVLIGREKALNRAIKEQP